MSNTLNLTTHENGTGQARQASVDKVVIAGWTGSNQADVKKHIAELEALGVRAPSKTPIFYRVAAARLTTAGTIEATGDSSGGEVEFVLLQADGRRWIGVGSDHTDRTAEAYDITVSKQMCDKPIAPDFWLFDDVAGHWDQLVLRSFVYENGERVPYQEGPVTSMLSPDKLLDCFRVEGELVEGMLMFCGTLAARGGVRPTARFEIELEDTMLKRSIKHSYSVQILPVSA